MGAENSRSRMLNAVYYRLIEKRFQQQHLKLLEREIIGSCRTILDVGCGNGNHMRTVAPYLTRSVGIDLFQESLDTATHAGIYSETKRMSATAIQDEFGQGSFDGVVAFDLIEHLEKADGLRLLDAMEHIASKKVVVFTPNGFLRQKSPERQ